MTLSFSWLRLPGLMAALLGAGVAAGSLSGCAPDLGAQPAVKPLASYATTQSLAAPAAAHSADWPTDAWWTAYGDPQLDALEARALAGSPDLAVAAARVRQARATLEAQGAEGKPQFAANGSVQTHKQSLNEGFPDAFKSFLPSGYHTQTNARSARP